MTHQETTGPQPALSERSESKGCAILMLVLIATAGLAARQNRIDLVTPSAPELAAYGPLSIGVRTIQVTDKKRGTAVGLVLEHAKP